GIGVLCQIEGEVPVLDVLAEWLPNFDVDAVEQAVVFDEDDYDEDDEGYDPMGDGYEGGIGPKPGAASPA
ncbi:MAG: hypothetical protein ACXV0U_04035, partial [Kineosporiaceae bacterium]